MKPILEICAFNIQSCIIAEKAGAARVELCDNPVEGGTTPGPGSIALTRETVSIDLYPIIRPRAGNYLYDELEFEMMKRDIAFCREVGCDGISVGIQLPDGRIDVNRLKRIVEWAYPMGVTCNRVFDVAPDPFEALEQIIEAGCERILSSGLRSGAPEGAELLRELIAKAAGRIIIMPGAGIRSSNIETLMQQTGATEYHTSARMKAANTVTHQNPDVLDIGDVYLADEQEVRKIVTILQQNEIEDPGSH